MPHSVMFGRKALSILLAAVLTAGLLPVLPAYAADDSNEADGVEQEQLQTEVQAQTEPQVQSATPAQTKAQDAAKEQGAAKEQDAIEEQAPESPESTQNPSSTSQKVAPLAADATGSCGPNATWSSTNGVLTITGKGAITNPSSYQSLSSSVSKVVIGEGITEIGNGAFVGFSNLATVQLPSTLVAIRNGAFSRCSSLTSVSLPSKLSVIEENAFERTGLTSVTLPASVTSIASTAFFWTQSMGSISVAQGNKSYKAISGVLYTADGTEAVCCPPAKTGTLTLPSTVTKIAPYAFMQTELTTVNMPSSLKEIGKGAFYLSRITSVAIPNSVSYLMNQQFSNCMNLKSVKMGSGLKQVSTGDFEGCTSLSQVDLGNVESVQTLAFEGCTALKNVTIPKSVLRIDERSFPGSTELSFAQPGKLTQLENGTYMHVGQVRLNVKECYSQAFSMLELVNAERAKNGLKPLVMDKDLVDAAMHRAAECALVFDPNLHYRPCALQCFSVLPSKIHGENIATTPMGTQTAFNLWMNSSGHRANMLDEDYKSIGIGCVTIGGTQFWVQDFGWNDASPVASKSDYKDASKTPTIYVVPAKGFYEPDIQYSATSLVVGKTAKITCNWKTSGMRMPVPSTSLLYTSSNPKVATVSPDGTIKAIAPGTTTVKAYFKGLEEEAVSKTISVTTAPVATAVTGSNSTVSMTASYTYDGTAKKPAPTVKVNGKTLKSGTDYTVSYRNNVNPGTATATISFKGNYTGTLAKSFKIAKASLAKASVSVASTLPYSGKALKPAVTVKLGGKALKNGTDYTVSYKNNAGSSMAGSTAKATVTVTGKGNYVGSVSKTYQIKTPSIQYYVHRQTFGWEKSYSKHDGVQSGTTGQKKRLEGIYVRLANKPVSGSIQYRTHVQKIGWQGWRSEGQMSGTTGKKYRLEAIQIRLTGDMAKKYDVYYRVHAQKFGWMGWAKNGAQAGTAGYAYRLESIQIKLVPKGGAAPASADGVPSTKGKAAFSQKRK